MLGFVQVILLCLPIALGASLLNAAIKVEEVSNSEGWPWPIMQRPSKEGASVIYDRYNGVYIKGRNEDGLDARGSCYGANFGGACCIGIYCSYEVINELLDKDVSTVGVKHEQFSSDIDPNKVRKIVLHSDGTTDIDYVDHGNIDAACIGIRAGSCCVGLCCGCLEAVGNSTSVATST